jgi:hypothetical protein
MLGISFERSALFLLVQVRIAVRKSLWARLRELQTISERRNDLSNARKS